MFTSLLVVFLLRQWFLMRKAREAASEPDALGLHQVISLNTTSAS
ncbi:MAG: hypothetical protein ACI9VR_002827 [Cognaticolwellia sp.]|jgi:hypothetical protein